MENDFECDYLIIGGGIAGLAAAYYLAENGENAAVIEKSFVGSGRTAAENGYLVRDGMPFYSRYSVNYDNEIDELERMCRMIHEKSFVSRPLYIYSDHPSDAHEIRRIYADCLRGGLDADLFSAKKCAERCPFDAYRAVKLTDCAVSFDVRSFSRKLSNFLSVHGTPTAELTMMTSISREKNGFRVKTGAGTEIFAKTIVDTRPVYPKMSVFTAKTAPLNDFSCALMNLRRRNVSVHSDDAGRLVLTLKKSGLAFFRDSAIAYCEELAAATVYSENSLAVTEFSVGKREITMNARPEIRKMYDGYYRFYAPYADGIPSALRLGKLFAENRGKKDEGKPFAV